jgi:hypothetical protein
MDIQAIARGGNYDGDWANNRHGNQSKSEQVDELTGYQANGRN